MLIRTLSDIENTEFFVEWGGGTSHRLLVEKDGLGFSVCLTIVRAGTDSLLKYRNHLEACYCIRGEGEVEDMEGNVYPLRSGTLYALDKNDQHYLRGGLTEDLILISVFNPALKGTERHILGRAEGSSY